MSPVLLIRCGPPAARAVVVCSLLTLCSCGTATLALRPDDAKENNQMREDPETSDTFKQDTFSHLLGDPNWPRDDQERRPPRTEKALLSPGVGHEVCAILAIVIGFMACARLNDYSGSPSGMAKRAAHFSALATATSWRHMHWRAVPQHVMRLLVSAIFLGIIYYARKFISSFLVQHKTVSVMLEENGFKEGDILEAVVGGAICIAAVYIGGLSMIFFTSQVYAEAESGLRHLLHVSGVNRSAYIAATIFANALEALVVMTALFVGSAVLLSARLVIWTSPVMMLMSLILFSVSAVVMGYVLHFICPGSRSASLASKCIFIIITFAGFAAPSWPVVPLSGQHGWCMLLMPVVTAHKASLQFVTACGKGRCMMLADLQESFQQGHWMSPYRMAVGVQHEVILTPPDAFISLMIWGFVQVAVGIFLIVMLDMRRHPNLHIASAGSSSDPSTSANDSCTSPLEVIDLVHSYGYSWTSTEPILRGVSLRCVKGELVGLLGPNGAGKTTTIRCITGEEKAKSGTVTINSRMCNSNSGVFIGLCPQETVLSGELTVAENLRFFARVRGASLAKTESCVDQLLLATRLMEKKDNFPDTLSGGMRRRLGVGCAMIGTPSVTILDEPSTGLDPLSRRGIWETIIELKAAGSCCLLTTHLLEEAEYLCNDLVILKKGAVAARGSVQKLKQEWNNGYMLSIDFCIEDEAQVRKFLRANLSEHDYNAEKVQSSTQMIYQLTCDEESLGHLIIAIARGKTSSGIKHWGLSQASLEDTYLRIIAQADPDISIANA
eukprot:TRINITY_DN3664_c0_g1_i4.p1 TRINITY_DN3664_c0_g1~~TRINITY_DN3664_c0_g1_i4.p1  ORF type:complete len:781 (-),score=108.60 TRINITY_DN3664_c0_g1_i4:108-2450(-)